jgi:hypothetical protein
LTEDDKRYLEFMAMPAKGEPPYVATVNRKQWVAQYGHLSAMELFIIKGKNEQLDLISVSLSNRGLALSKRLVTQDQKSAQGDN